MNDQLSHLDETPVFGGFDVTDTVGREWEDRPIHM